MEEEHGLNVQMLSTFLKNKLHDSKLTEVVSYDVKLAVPKGENYTSLVYRVKLCCLQASGKKKTVSLIVKSQLTSTSALKVLAAFSIFRTEIKMYSTTLPLMEDLVREFEDKRETPWGTMYGYQPYSLVAFEDLTDHEYAVADRRKGLDLNHAKLVLRNVGRFHALSKVLLSRGLLSNEDKGILVHASTEESMRRMWIAMFVVLSDALANHWGPEWLDISKKLVSVGETAPERLTELIDSYDPRFQVLNHGDLWTCNMMFKHLEYEEIPVSVKLLDFQVCHLNSFAWDLIYFLATSIVPAVRRANMNLLFTTYQEALEVNLKRYNYTGYIPTVEDVKSEYKRIEFAAVGFTSFHPMTRAKTQEALNMDKVMTHPPHEVIDSTVYTDGVAKDAIGDDLIHFASIGLI